VPSGRGHVGGVGERLNTGERHIQEYLQDVVTETGVCASSMGLHSTVVDGWEKSAALGRGAAMPTYHELFERMVDIALRWGGHVDPPQPKASLHSPKPPFQESSSQRIFFRRQGKSFSQFSPVTGRNCSCKLAISYGSWMEAGTILLVWDSVNNGLVYNAAFDARSLTTIGA
jgi:hypothetical protein